VPAPGATPGHAPVAARGERHRPFLLALLLLDLLYYAYRYPLQVNDALTSSTYGDTPFLLKVADDAVFVLLLGVVVLLKAADRTLLLNRRHVLAAGAIVVCFSQVILGGGLDAVLKVKGVLLYSALLAVMSAADVAWLLDLLRRNLVRLFLCLLAVDAVQIALFVAIGRPPALAWSTERSALLSQDVRFGSLWDDPNSFGLFLALFVTWAAFQRTAPWKRAALILPAVAAALFTWSRTSFVLTAAGLGLALLAASWDALAGRRYTAATWRVLLVTASAIAAGLLLPRALEWAARQDSARIHLDAVLLRHVRVSALSVPSRSVVHSESVFTFLAQNAGWVSAVLLFVVLLAPVAGALASDRVPRDQRFLVAWAAIFCLSFVAIPFLWLAPMGLVFFLVYGRLLAFAGRRPGA
jgi:hypothetical protein